MSSTNSELQAAVEAHVRKHLAISNGKKRHPEKSWEEFTGDEQKMAEIWHMLYFYDVPEEIQERWIREDVEKLLPHAEAVWKESGETLPLSDQDWLKAGIRSADAGSAKNVTSLRQRYDVAPPDRKQKLEAMIHVFESKNQASRELHEEFGMYSTGTLDTFTFGSEGRFSQRSKEIQERFQAELAQIEREFSATKTTGE